MGNAPSGTVTFLFTDIEGSTALWESHPADVVGAAISRHDEILRGAVEKHSGHVFKMVGDACCAAFASPQNALLAAIASQRGILAEQWAGGMVLRVRMALHTGLSEERGGDYFGPPVNRVARLLSAGHGGQVLLSAVTYGLVRDPLTHAEPDADLPYMGEHRLKDLRYAERIFQLAVPDLPSEFPPLRTHGLIETTPGEAVPGTNTPQPGGFAPRPERVEERYRRIRPLGGGGMAEVFLAHDEKLDQEVALKVLRPQYADNDQFIERFRREARSAAKLRSHPNIVPIYDRGEGEDGSYFIVMEYVPGGTLEDLIRKNGPLAPERARSLALQIAKAIRESHRRDMIHRDIKPQNILITESGEAKVADFGIARAASLTTLTLEGSVMGTPHYISPEQAKGEDAGPGSDLYSLGVVLYEMLTGDLPFTATSPVGMMMKHISEAVRPPMEMNPAVPATLNAVALSLLAKEPSDRHPSAAALVEELETLDLTEAPDRMKPGETITDAAAGAGAGTILDKPPAEPGVGGADVTGGHETAGGAGESDGRDGGRRRGAAPWVVAGVGIAIVAALLITPLLLGGREASSGSVMLPNVVDATRSAAAEELRAAGFEVEVAGAESSEEDSGRVISQNPVGGEEAESGSTATIIIGEGSSEEATDAEEEAPDEAESANEEPSEEEPLVAEVPPGFEVVSDGSLALEVPAEWGDRLTGAESEEGNGWSNVGLVEASITASPDVDTFSNVGGVPGVYAVASRELAESFLDDDLVSTGPNDFSSACQSSVVEDYERDGYSGTVKEWSDCSDGPETTYLTLSAAPEGRECVALISVGVASSAELSDVRHILDNFEVDCGGGNESAESPPSQNSDVLSSSFPHTHATPITYF